MLGDKNKNAASKHATLARQLTAAIRNQGVAIVSTAVSKHTRNKLPHQMRLAL